jgi:uncharacterized membrane protein
MSKIQIPAAAFDQHIIVLGKTRSGKSSAMRVLVEYLLDKQEPVTIVDPKGDWWGLKASADGKSAGYPVVIFGGEHGDVPLNARSGASVAELVATGNRSAIIDLGGWMPGDRTQFWIDFASTYFRTHKGRHYLVIDEVHNLAPKGKIMDPNAGKMLHWSNRLASEGLGKGISMIAASQRPQKVHNDFLTSCETLLAMRVIHKSDRDALKDWIDACGDPEKGKEVLATVASLSRGEAWAYSPEYEFGPKRVQFPMFDTYDSFKPQKAGADVKLKGWAEVDLADVTKKLEAAVKEAEATDPKKLQLRIRELEKQLREKPEHKLQSTAADPREIKRIVRELEDEYGRKLSYAAHVQFSTWQKGRKLIKALDELAKSAIALFPPEEPKIPDVQTHKGTPEAPRQAITPRSELRTAFKPSVRPESVQTNGDLPEGEREILKAIAKYSDGVKRDQLSVLTGYKRSTRDAYIARLRPKGYIDERGGTIIATDAGVSALGHHYEQLPPSGDELQRYWLERLPDGEKKILEILLQQDQGVDREALTDATGYKRSTRDAYLARMTAKRIVQPIGRGQVKAVEEFFA